jgi:hypothetical protein
MRAVHTALALIALGASGTPVVAQTAAPAPAPPAAEAAIHGYGDRDKTCLAWTDQCRSCTRADNDEVHCSNIGIACQPAAEIACTARKPEPAK